MPSSQWKKGFRISPHHHSHGRLCFEPQSKRATLILEVWELQDLIGESAHFATVKTVMPYLIVKHSEHKYRGQPNMLSSRLKGKLCKEVIVWQLAYVLQLPNKSQLQCYISWVKEGLGQILTDTPLLSCFSTFLFSSHGSSIVIRFRERASPTCH